MRFHNKVVLITGGGSGIGQATAVAFAAEGAQVAIHDISADAAAQTQAMIKADGCAVARAYEVDVSSPSRVRGVVAETVSDFGSIDVLVTSAGVTHIAHPFEVSDED